LIADSEFEEPPLLTCRLVHWNGRALMPAFLEPAKAGSQNDGLTPAL